MVESRCETTHSEVGSAVSQVKEHLLTVRATIVVHSRRVIRCARQSPDNRRTCGGGGGGARGNMLIETVCLTTRENGSILNFRPPVRCVGSAIGRNQRRAARVPVQCGV